MTLGSTTSALPTPWRYQGRLLLNTADGGGANTDLYDFVARAYDPALGVFTSQDTERGSAQNPLTLNRFLYAQANPERLIDPDGHWGWDSITNTIGQVASNAGNFAVGFGEGVVDATVSAVTGTVDLGRAAVGATVDAGGCALNATCRNQAIASAGNAVQAVVRNPGEAVRRSVNAAGNAIGAAASAAGNLASSTANRVTTAWNTGNFRELGKMTGEVAANFVPVGGVLTKVGAVGRLTASVGRLASGLGRVDGALGRATSLLSRASHASERLVGAARGKLDELVGQRLRGAASACVNSFLAATLVATPAGLVPIGSIQPGDQVTAYDEATGTTAAYPVSVVHINDDPVTGEVVIDGETITTTPEHPFYTLEEGWTSAKDLRSGMHVPSDAGDPGVVQSVDFSGGPGTMYNLTVEVAHTFFVGEGGWLVHNCFGPTYGSLRNAHIKDSHHIIQDAAVRELPGYSRTAAPAMRLDGPANRLGTPHYRATRVQVAARTGGTYGAERRIAYRAMRRAGVDRAAARANINRADRYFASIGVTKKTVTRIPLTRRGFLG